MARREESHEAHGVSRLVDACQHFLGLMKGGELFIYCHRCKRFLLVKHAHPNSPAVTPADETHRGVEAQV